MTGIGLLDEPKINDISPKRRRWFNTGNFSKSVKVWWLDLRDHNKNRIYTDISFLIAQMMDNEIIPSLFYYFGRYHLSDKGKHRFFDPLINKIDVWDGKDERLDIYLNGPEYCGLNGDKVQVCDVAQTIAYPPGSAGRPAFIILRLDQLLALTALNNQWMYGQPWITKLRDTLAHEYTHVMLYTYKPKINDNSKPDGDFFGEWLQDATAQWAYDYIYPLDDTEQSSDSALTVPGSSLGKDSYGSYLFLYYLTRFEDRDIVRKIWEYSESGSINAMQALNHVIDQVNVFKEIWDSYIKFKWDQDVPFRDRDDEKKTGVNLGATRFLLDEFRQKPNINKLEKTDGYESTATESFNIIIPSLIKSGKTKIIDTEFEIDPLSGAYFQIRFLTAVESRERVKVDSCKLLISASQLPIHTSDGHESGNGMSAYVKASKQYSGACFPGMCTSDWISFMGKGTMKLCDLISLDGRKIDNLIFAISNSNSFIKYKYNIKIEVSQ